MSIPMRLTGPAKFGPLAACLCETHRAPLYFIRLRREDEGHIVEYPYAGLVEAVQALRSFASCGDQDNVSLWRRSPIGWKEVTV